MRFACVHEQELCEIELVGKPLLVYPFCYELQASRLASIAD
jgi:hypothetical protein